VFEEYGGAAVEPTDHDLIVANEGKAGPVGDSWKALAARAIAAARDMAIVGTGPRESSGQPAPRDTPQGSGAGSPNEGGDVASVSTVAPSTDIFTLGVFGMTVFAPE